MLLEIIFYIALAFMLSQCYECFKVRTSEDDPLSVEMCSVDLKLINENICCRLTVELSRSYYRLNCNTGSRMKTIKLVQILHFCICTCSNVLL
jgi:hypothetical protein